jgi:hypothetical protein
VLAVAMLALFLFGQGFGPGAHTMTFASLSYRPRCAASALAFQTLMRSSSTLSLFLFPLLVASLDTAVFWVIALAPFIGLASLLAIRWEPSGMMWMRRITASFLAGGAALTRPTLRILL